MFYLFSNKLKMAYMAIFILTLSLQQHCEVGQTKGVWLAEHHLVRFTAENWDFNAGTPSLRPTISNTTPPWLLSLLFKIMHGLPERHMLHVVPDHSLNGWWSLLAPSHSPPTALLVNIQRRAFPAASTDGFM